MPVSYPPQPPAPPQGPQGPQGPYQQPQYPQQQYQQPYQQQQYGQYPQAPFQAKSSPLALTAFIISLACVVLVWVPKISLIAWLANLAAFILGIVANSQIKKSAGALTGKGYAVAAIVISCVLFGILLIMALLIGAFVGSMLRGL